MVAEKIRNFIKSEVVLVAAWGLALLSMLVIPPDSGYASYVDVRTLLLLFSLMGVTAGCRELGFFRRMGELLLRRVRSSRQLELLLVLLCFFSSMVVTNDVALLTFVPFAVEILLLAGLRDRVPMVVVLQTVAANLGSMLLPVGNPQNIYIYTRFGCSLGEFVLQMLPYTAVSLVLVVGGVCLGKSRRLEDLDLPPSAPLSVKRLLPYGALFAVSLLAVLRVLPAEAAFGLVLLVLLLTDRPVLGKIDYALLVTFVGFFLFVGNMGRVPFLRDWMESVLTGHEALVSALLSQGISNVPAALLLSGFTEAWRPLLVGVNLGGLGTLIASMASLISYKYVSRQFPEKKGAYFRLFTGVNVLFFVILVGLCALLQGGL